MTIHKLTAGDGYTYLTRQVAGGDVPRERGQSAAEYYTAQGNPPGVWAGRGAPLLGLARERVSEQQMFYLFGLGMHPDAEKIAEEHIAAHKDEVRTARGIEVLVRHAYQAAALGRAFPSYEGLEAFETRVAHRLAVIARETGRAPTLAESKRVRAQEARRQRAAVAGFDVVFALVKSAAILWALDERAEVRATVRAAHEAARDAALDLLEQHAAYTRTGSKGQAQIETWGLIAAVFDHYDSRAGDPNLHTHVAISSKVLGVDGRWRALDARGLYRMTVAASEFYNTRFETELAARLGVSFTARPDTAGGREPVREIAGIPTWIIEHFSARRHDIESRYAQLVREYRREHGHDPSAGACHKLARQANLDTREGKKAPRSLAEMRTDWAQSVTDAFGPDGVATVMAAVPAQTPTPLASTALDPVEVAARVVANVAEARSTWTVWNLRAEAERLARLEAGFATAAEHARFVEAVIEHAVAPALCIRVDAPALLDEPARLRRSDGTSVFTEHAAALYTSQLILDAEARLLAAATETAPLPPIASVLANTVLNRFEAEHGRLDSGQRALALAFATDPRILTVGLGPAGSGKTTAMRAFTALTEAARRRVIALGASAASAAVLGEELGVSAQNLHKFLWEYTHGPVADALHTGGPIPPDRAQFQVGPGDVILLDEAGMAGTLNLDRLVKLAAHHGATVRLLGDHRQLGAVESGGALRLLVTEHGAVELTSLHRFRNRSEAAATLQLRDGDTAAFDFYQQHQRIIGGSRDAMIEAAYQGWRVDVLAGKTSLMAAATNQDVTALNTRARADRVATGQVEAAGTVLRDGNLAGVGDWITTRRNDRRMTVCSGRDFVKNGDTWTVLARREDGSLIVKHRGHSGRATLPNEYVRRHAELAYATTAHRAQGSTVDTAHPLITGEMTRENLYVIATRARERTMLYVATHQIPDLDPDEHLDKARIDPNAYAAREILEQILGCETAELSATETIRHAQDQVTNLSVLIPNYQHAYQTVTARPYIELDQAQADPGSENRFGLVAPHDVSGTSTPGNGHAREVLSVPADEPRSAPLPWLSAPPTPGVLDPTEHAYLRDAARLIRQRIKNLTEQVATDEPAWARKLGAQPVRAADRVAWGERIGIIAAYREQNQITDNDPQHPLGPYIESAYPDSAAYRYAYRAASALRQAARGRPWTEINPQDDTPLSANNQNDAQRENAEQPQTGQRTQAEALAEHRRNLSPSQQRKPAEAAEQRRIRKTRTREHAPTRSAEAQSERRPMRQVPQPHYPDPENQPRIGW